MLLLLQTNQIFWCYVAGEFAKIVEQKSNEQIRDECMSVFRQAKLNHHDETIAPTMKPTTIPDPTAIYVRTRLCQCHGPTNDSSPATIPIKIA